MEIIAFDGSGGFLETNIIESGKRGSMNISDSVIRNQKMFLPSHINVIRVLQTLIVKVVRIKVLCILVK